MFKILPSEKFTIKTYLRPDRVADKLLNYVEPYQLIRFSFPFAPPPDKPYEGSVENGFFRMQRISRYKKRNNLPTIEGQISPEERGSVIDVIIKPNKFLNFFMLVFPLFYTSMALVVGFSLWQSNDNGARNISMFLLFSPLWTLLGCFVVFQSFKSDVKKDKNFLLEIFE